MTLEDAARDLADVCANPDDVREAIVEFVLACWHDSDQSLTTLTSLFGAVVAANQVLFKHLGDTYDRE